MAISVQLLPSIEVDFPALPTYLAQQYSTFISSNYISYKHFEASTEWNIVVKHDVWLETSGIYVNFKESRYENPPLLL